jgi:hypothetical protein
MGKSKRTPSSLALPTRAQRRRGCKEMAIQSKDDQEPAFDSVLASGLYPAAVRLAHLAVQTTPLHADADSADAAVATPEQLSEQVRFHCDDPNSTVGC